MKVKTFAQYGAINHGALIPLNQDDPIENEQFIFPAYDARMDQLSAGMDRCWPDLDYRELLKGIEI